MSDKKEMTIEEQFTALEGIILKMEAEDVSLEESFELYNEGIKLVKNCNDKIDMVEKKIKIVEEVDE